VTGLFNLASTVIDKIFPDKTEAEKAKLRLMELEQSGELAAMQTLQQWDKAQTEVNAVEAAHKSLFVAGWRPAAGWICNIGLALVWVGFPILDVALKTCGRQVAMPVIDTGELFTLITCMLGLGGLRTFEKIRKARK